MKKSQLKQLIKEEILKVLSEDQGMVDKILDKISQYGIKSLSQQELDTLNKFSKGENITDLSKDEENTLNKILDKANTQGRSNLSFLERDWMETNFPFPLFREYDTLYLSDPIRKFLQNNRSTKPFYAVQKYIDNKVSQAKQTNNLQNLINSGYFENDIEKELIDWYNKKYNEKMNYIGDDIKNHLKKIYNQEPNIPNIIYSDTDGNDFVDKKNLLKLLKKHFSLDKLKDELINEFIDAVYSSGTDLYTEISEREWVEEYSVFLEDYEI